MPTIQDLSTYAAAIAPVVNAVHVNVHASARQAAAAHAESCGVTPGLLADLRYVLPLRPLTRRELSAVYRYGSAADLDAEIRDHLDQDTVTEGREGLLRVAPRGLAFIDGLYAVHAATTRRIWAAHDLGPLAALAGRVLCHAGRDRGGALEVMAPPYEPEGTPAGVLLFNRLAALRYHRADAHAAAWEAAGFTAGTIVDLQGGPRRDGIEDDTNRRAAQPYQCLTTDERGTLFEGLLTLL
ncbi:hypothetical protein [Nonomuraea lactucae]|uniref:hypothetical protein n=1 Tax=Nonomuraea lactucae TaxID=2249762 RepID=UPI000DE1BAD3|nr:hypothetical protein [Nonomuraea lactucae]